MKPYLDLFQILILVISFLGISCQFRKEARWCATSAQELSKCESLQHAITQRMQRSNEYPPNFKPYQELPELRCVQGGDSFACMEMISEIEADLMQLDPGMAYTAGEYFTMVPLAAEKYDTLPGDDSGLEYYAVAVVRRDNPGFDVDTLKTKKACHTGVGRAAGWVYPISTLIEKEIMGIAECNVPVKSAAAFFGPMCAPNGLARFYNPFGNNPVTVCENCLGTGEIFCSDHDPFAGYDGAFTCMANKQGDVAFIRDRTIYQMTSNSSGGMRPEDFELLCPDGGRASPSAAESCNWGVIRSHVIMTSAIHEEALREDYTMLLELMSFDFGENGEHRDIFHMFSSLAYGNRNLMFSDETKMLLDVKDVEKGSRDTYFTWVGEEYRRRNQILNTCPLQQARWCVISKYEMLKCENMIMAFAAKGLKPDLNCIRGTSTRDCMDKIRLGDADMIALDAADVYVAGKYYGLIPIAAEDYSGYEEKSYYAVAVARRTDSHLTIFNLKNRRTCHSAVYTAAGWISPVDKLIETGQIHVDDRDVYFNVGQFFSKSCVPGSLNDYYNTKGTNPINLCEACAAGPPDRCQRNQEELYYGNSGAFRCLTEKGGDVAFVKHTTVRENTDGRNKAEWARNRRSDDYELLCNDGTRRDIDNWESCNMGEIPANAIVTAEFKTEEERQIYWTLLNFAQNFFASDTNNDFSMFASGMLDYKDLIFQDSTVRLVAVEPDEQNYVTYLGPRFVRAMERMEGIDSITAASCHPVSSLILITALALLSWFRL